MATKPVQRPLSPHLGIYKWGPAMLVSILHRATGDGMALVGTFLVVAWLACAAAGPDAYAAFMGWFTQADGGLNPLGYLVGIGLTWSLFQHMASGVRHLFLDVGAGYELRVNRQGAVATIAFSAVATIAFWAFVLVGK
ncbi:succinate dehydrogenase, cytochrome b556 subunit [Sphingomonas baiyangensis]|uniref:Succinate dehydrogenase cytochrome b556 subunit n=1 Tax=Sphingomonas baiyangensis TaxID=2572576 RepID=A0A4U1L692_9SPHN|nr:succinate dehydrogenase, cytochrome b556 subunit [Sphingomonas baiyangensis]TKD51780.1 succinate dehydrogenase, cytochrome b556 subunit [Sphingomonas baiyangensis]